MGFAPASLRPWLNMACCDCATPTKTTGPIRPIPQALMMNQTNETAFEPYIEHVLLTRSGWQQGTNQDWDKDRAIFATEAIAFIQDTQPAMWEQMDKQHGAELEPKLIVALLL